MEDTIVTREISVLYYRGEKLLYRRRHTVWDIDRFIAARDKEAAEHAADKDDRTGFTRWEIE